MAEGLRGKHIGASFVKAGRRGVTFWNTRAMKPTAMRARGAQVTDIVVLVVADGGPDASDN